MANCRSCGDEIEWAETENGKRMPINAAVYPLRADAHPDYDGPWGNLVIDRRRATEHGMTPVVKYVKAGEGNRLSHFATCEQAEQHRR